ncbi:HAD-IIIA family hydrolase [Candidatus Accumulibacter phosphatis]|jgi:phosphoglycolate phosphatase|uniref:HAD-IIIA family hydrolase n=1 Tax=Candidatus Accumulibacter phosphatis TaxID=327160 RepID=A0ABX1TZB5_9PROT|nr:HAD-IIIA family hydrolase [Candidatus Accumulibacter phosphatis]NMQ28553.1 HAD-IIIA family hydrolase [Candidatus Accumulibacter phosphatis]
MASRFKLLVFDWDGTLLDSAGAIVEAIQAACSDLGLPIPADERARHVIGLGLHDALRFAVPNLPADSYPLMVERYRHHYLQHDHELQLFDGAAAMIAELAAAGFLLAVATGKSRIGLDRALRSSGLGPYFHASRCADECFSKPHPQMLEELMDELSVDPERTLMIGDTTHDLLMGKNAGVACLAAGYGAHPAAALDALAPLARLQEIDEVAQWLRINA